MVVNIMEAIVPSPTENRTSAAATLRKRMGDNLQAIGRDRDEAAFADVYDYYAGRVKSFLMGKGMNEDIAEELTQEIMLARNRRIDYLRSNSRIEVELDDEMLDAETTETDPQANFVANAQAAEQLNRALDTLPPEQRQVMHLSYFRGQSHGAIARWLNLPIGTVKSRIRLAMHAVRAYLQSEKSAADEQPTEST